MKVIDGLIFGWNLYDDGAKIMVHLTCGSEGGKLTGHGYHANLAKKGQPSGEEIERGVAALQDWFEKHTRPPEGVRRGDKAWNNKPYKPAGWLKRLTEEQIATERRREQVRRLAVAKKMDDGEAGDGSSE